MPKNVLITGASSGFGRLITLSLLERGHRVVASMRRLATKNKQVAQELRAAGAITVEIDVTDQQSVETGVAEALTHFDCIHVLVNNAGVGVVGLQENFTPDDWQRLFNVNVFGVQRMNRAVLPHMRACREGLLIFLSSILARLTLPFYGPYNASKWAIEAMAENYRVELSEFGIESCLVEPGGYPTTFMNNLMQPSDHSRDESYGKLAQVVHDMFANFEQALAATPAQDPQNVANAVVALVDGTPGERPFRTIVDKMGMGELLTDYNAQLERITHQLYESFGMADMLEVKPPPSDIQGTPL
ncbi:MAG: SDR family oxidoreductase [Desulfofustis sp. PB-SRB1]|jgi:NAD(P)-dependent dehydrogenase (short-subunit alcohol dehydrogenase family)|nr:SDR family oxidoreductase [Desulfofustis sp. PB-SRB1]MBM1000860.1 SDR family oxidoreductase [Desulfofustis sp. PB-SRB1]HBH28229.1 SDR family NAD(P)-dependent oxidoreductase [Desulfofustis sp.]